MAKKKVSSKPNPPKLHSLKGMRDIMGDEYYNYQGFFEKAQEVAIYYGFNPIELPILEYEDIFTSSVGIGTDIIDKEMYKLKPPRSRDKIAMRPEGTAGSMRAYIEHGMRSLPQPVMLYYYGPFFRHDKPQRGRLRELRQFGLEIMGTDKSIADALIIQATVLILKEAGAQDLIVEVNSIGDKECRPVYIRELTSYYKKHIADLCPNCKDRIKTNPLRLLDCKEEECQEIKEGAPDSVSFLDPECKKHFKEVLEYLEEMNVPYQINKNLVRGLSYYTRTVFEVKVEKETEDSDIENNDEDKKADTIENKKDFSEGLAIAGGGRYDYLAKAMGHKKDIPSVGVSIGVDRIVMSSWYKKLSPRIVKKPKIYFIKLGLEAKLKSLNIIEILRQAKIPLVQSITKDSIGAQLAIAEKLKIPYTIIFGQKEAMDNSVIVRDMKNRSQKTINIEDLQKYIKTLK
ncbi:histidine--tRNA ligase [Candidatus Wolfebacteria bacterium]|nr:MAG: histidine--tRNA ligase [Candidatus Wolfebacteria bacterium]